MSQLNVTRTDGIVTVEFSRPGKLNALSPELLDELIEVCQALAADDDARVVVLVGAGSSFSAGADLPAFDQRLESDGEATADLGRRAADALARIPQISIASIHGHCVGGAIVLAACCDLRVAADTARFSIPEVHAGIPLAWGGMGHLIRLVGETMATDLVLSCRAFGADEAFRAGFLTRVVPAGEQQAVVAELARSTAGKAKKVLRLIKQQLVSLRDGTFDARNDAKALLAAREDDEARKIGLAYVENRLRNAR